MLARRARGQVIMLAISFLLGMGVNLIGLPSESSGAAKATTATLLGLHILIGIGLLAGAALALWRSGPLDPATKNMAWAGAILILVTFITGIFATTTESNWWSYLMALGFILAFLVYGRLLLSPRTAA